MTAVLFALLTLEPGLSRAWFKFQGAYSHRKYFNMLLPKLLKSEIKIL